MSAPRIRALVLAAGEGTRLRPLTLAVPKPLLPVGGAPILAHTLSFLAEAGCEAAAINLHHLGDQIRGHLGDAFGDMPLVYSEEEELLGTLGAFDRLGSVFESADLAVVVNGDSLCRWPLQKVIRKHQKSGAVATLLVSDKADPESFGGGIGLDGGDRIVSFRRGEGIGEAVRRSVFAGLHVFSPRLLEGLEPGKKDFVTDLYRPLLEEGAHLQSVPMSRDWHDLGTPSRYLEGVLDWTRGRTARRLIQNRSLVAEGAEIHPSAGIQSSAIESGAVVEAGARLEQCVILPGARIGEGCDLRDAIVGYGAEVPPATTAHGRMINANTAEFSPRPEDSVVGDLVYTPLEKPPARSAEVAPPAEDAGL